MAIDKSGISSPPPRKGTQGAARSRTPSSAPNVQKYEDGLNGIAGIAAFGLMVAGQKADAAAITTHGPNLFHEVALLASKNDKVAHVLDYLTEAGPYAGIITAAMPLVLQIMVNHGRIPAEKVPGGIVRPPAALVAEVDANIAQQMEAVRREQELNERIAYEKAGLNIPESAETAYVDNGTR